LFLATGYSEDEQPFLDSTGCNKMIMIVTDGATETALHVFQNRNWIPDNISTCHPIEVKKNSLFNLKFELYSLDSCIYIYDWQRIRRSKTYSLDVMC
jgi:hypothetical protein